ISIENPLWGAPRIHGELLKLDFEVAQSTVANTWPSDRDRQVRDSALFCVTTRQTLLPWICSLSRPLASTRFMLSFIVRLDRRQLVWVNVTTNPTAEWIARPLPSRPSRGPSVNAQRPGRSASKKICCASR